MSPLDSQYYCDNFHDDETLVQLRTMLRQESLHYSCPNYIERRCRRLSQQQAQQEEEVQQQQAQSSNKHQYSFKQQQQQLGDECAKLVNDLSIQKVQPEQQQEEEKRSPRNVREQALQDDERIPSLPLDCPLVPWRQQMCTWAYTCVDSFGLDRSLVSYSFDLLDRYLSRQLVTDRRDFQLYAMTCLYMSVKVYESFSKLSVETMMDMSRGYFEAEDFLEVELDILETLNWRVSAPIPQSFCRLFWDLFPGKVRREWKATAQAILENAVQDPFFIPHKFSHLAQAAILIALMQYQVDDRKIKLYLDMTSNVVDMNDANFQAVYSQLQQY